MIGQNTGYGRSAINSKSANMTFTEQVDTYKLEDIAALQEEAFVDNIENYRYTVIYELSSVQHGDGSVKTMLRPGMMSQNQYLRLSISVSSWIRPIF